MLAMAVPVVPAQKRRITVIEKSPTEVCKPGQMSNDRLAFHLWNWEQWMHRRGFRRLWYPGKSAGPWKRPSLDFDEMVAAVDGRCAKAVFTIINDLPRPQCLALHHKHLGSVYCVRYDLDSAYAEGCAALGKELTKRGID